MFGRLPALSRLIRQLQKVPFLASKNIAKVAVYFLTRDDKTIDELVESIKQAREQVKLCTACFNWTEQQGLCSICSSPKRDGKVICVVETWHDLWSIENTGGYEGVYHILGGSLCPLEGIGPEHLHIQPLLKRLEGDVQEIIFATNPTPEGEATASFISSKIQHLPLTISKLASGVPTGSSLEYMDRITIAKALAGRRPY
ncbi:MAG: recombination protein RecR [Epsilonproteobacteria bacterium]|nr:recombination protein RecR [Campylobacterota bacterium]